MSVRSFSAVAAVAALGVFSSPIHADTLGLDVGPDGFVAECGLCGTITGQTYGWTFDVLTAVRVTGLGGWDAGADGIGPDVQVGLWNSAGTLLASTIIGNASTPVASNGAGQWLFESVGPLALAPGNYNIGLAFFTDTPGAQFGTAFTTDPRIRYIGARESPSGQNSGLTNPTGDFGTDGIFGPSLLLAPVPVPAGVVLLATALAGLGLARGRRTA